MNISILIGCLASDAVFYNNNKGGYIMKARIITENKSAFIGVQGHDLMASGKVMEKILVLYQNGQLQKGSWLQLIGNTKGTVIEAATSRTGQKQYFSHVEITDIAVGPPKGQSPIWKVINTTTAPAAALPAAPGVTMPGNAVAIPTIAAPAQPTPAQPAQPAGPVIPNAAYVGGDVNTY